MDTDSFVINMKTEDFYKDSANDENDERQLPTSKNKKVVGLFKDELGGKIMEEFVALRAKTYAYLMDDESEHKKAKGTKNMCNKKRAYV